MLSSLLACLLFIIVIPTSCCIFDDFFYFFILLLWINYVWLRIQIQRLCCQFVNNKAIVSRPHVGLLTTATGSVSCSSQRVWLVPSTNLIPGLSFYPFALHAQNKPLLYGIRHTDLLAKSTNLTERFMATITLS